MAVLFKIWVADRTKKIFVAIPESENMLEQLLIKSNAKLHINGCKIVTEKDGTLIDDEDVLKLCSKETLMILQHNEFWTKEALSEQNVIHEQEFTSDTDNVYPSSESSSILSNASPNMMLKKRSNSDENWTNFIIPWNKLEPSIIKELEAGNRNKYIITNTVNRVVSEMRAIQEFMPFKAFKIIARKIVEKYPKTFADLDDDGQYFGEGIHSLCNKLHDRNSYLNRPHMKRSLTRTLNIPLKRQKSLLVAKAGCSNWQPNEYKKEETENSLEEKRKFLETVSLNIDALNNDSEKRQKVYSYLEDTYPLQRLFINNVHNLPSMRDIKAKWPILLEKEFFIWHYEKLMQQSISVLKEQFVKKQERILAYGEKKFKNIMISSDKTEIKCIKIIMNHFKEDYNLIFMSYPEGTLLNEITPIIAAPSIAIIDADTPLYYLYIEQVMIMRIENSFLEALQVLMASYFIFNLAYPVKTSCTFEMIQKYLLKIHPDQGSKSRKSGDRYKVLSLFNKLRNIEYQKENVADSE